MIKLRKFKKSDADLLVSYLNDNEVTEYITGAIPQPYTASDAQWWIENGEMTEFIKAIEFEGELVGCISANIGEYEYSRSAELGYWVGKEYWNQGIATEAVNEFSKLIHETTDIVRLFVSVVSTNGASIRVLEKNGFTLEGLLRKVSFKNGHFFDEQMLAKISSKLD